MWIQSAVEWFKDPANSLAFAQLVAVFVTALATIALWRVTKVLAVETKTLAAMTSRPFVVSSFESSGADPTAINLTLRNTGNATAFDVRFCITPAPPKANGQPADNPEHSTFEISLLPSGQVLPLQGVMGRYVSDASFDVRVSWAALPNGKDREELSYKTAPKDGFHGGFNTKNVHHVAGELEKLRKQLPKQ
ncbi:hypothetical protein [Breoghania sp.]|uniref:hypothetical protein n=1 Tax=Breoghania sp. TaxID=2065378 RepID=UPI002AAC309E|nr:hypothetical protein [Breoghania sp.]